MRFVALFLFLIGAGNLIAGNLEPVILDFALAIFFYLLNLFLARRGQNLLKAINILITIIFVIYFVFTLMEVIGVFLLGKAPSVSTSNSVGVVIFIGLSGFYFLLRKIRKSSPGL